MITITAKEIEKEKESFEVCELAQSIFYILYDSKTQETISKEQFLETLPIPLQVAELLNDFLGPDSLTEAIEHVTIDQRDPGRALYYQDKLLWALEEIGRNDVAILVQGAIRQYEEYKKLDEETESALRRIDPHDDNAICDSLAIYIKKHAEEIVTKEYIEKSERALKGGASDTKKYEDRLKMSIRGLSRSTISD